MTNLVLVGVFALAWYCPCAKCCGKAHRPTASRVMPVNDWTAAAPRSVAFGTPLLIEGIGTRWAQDRMRRDYERKGRLELFHYDGRSLASSHKECLRRGVTPGVKVWRPQ